MTLEIAARVEDDSIGLGELLRVILKHRFKMLLAFAAVTAAVTVWTYRQIPVYESRAIFLVKLGRSYIFRPEVDQELSQLRESEALINAEIQILRSYDLAEIVVKRLGPAQITPHAIGAEDNPRVLSSVIRSFRRRLDVRPVRDSDMIEVAFEHPEPELTARAIRVLLEEFNAKRLRAFSDPRAAEFLARQVESYRMQLTETEDALRIFKLENAHFPEVRHRQRAELEQRLADVSSLITGLKRRLNYLQEKKRDLSSQSQNGQRSDRVIEVAAERLLELHLKEQRLLAQYTETNRLVQDIRNQIATVERFLVKHQETLNVTDPMYRDLERQIIDTVGTQRLAEAKQTGLDAQLAELELELKELPYVEERLRTLTRDRDTAERHFENYLERLEAARLADDMDRQKIANIAIIQKPVVPVKPIKPKKRVNLAIGGILGLALGFAIAFMTEFVIEPAIWKPAKLSDDELERVLDTITDGEDERSTLAIPAEGEADADESQPPARREA